MNTQEVANNTIVISFVVLVATGVCWYYYGIVALAIPVVCLVLAGLLGL